MIDPVDDATNYKWGVFYFNVKDTRVLVPKRKRWMGWTFNFARLESYLILLLIFAIVYGLRFF